MFHEQDSAIDYRKNTGIDRNDDFAPHAPREETDDLGSEAANIDKIREQFQDIDTTNLSLINNDENEKPLYRKLAAEEISRRLEEETEDTHDHLDKIVGGFDVYSD